MMLNLGILCIALGLACLIYTLERRRRVAQLKRWGATRLQAPQTIRLVAIGLILIVCGLVVTLASHSLHHQTEPLTNAWLREVQQQTVKNVPHTGMIVTIDIGEAKRTHPRNKQEVGRRLALVSLAQEYGSNVVASGPLYKSMQVEDKDIRMRFTHTDGGLVSHGGQKLQGFVVAGADKIFYWAQARIEGDEVVVSSDEVPHPVAARYAWANNPPADLYNGAGLPAAPFRTDAWPMPEER
jgi:hypothetical protein